jgi:hypothetical protein
VIVGQLLAPGDVDDPADLDAARRRPPLGLVEGCGVRRLAPAARADVMDRRGGDLRPANALARQFVGERVRAADQVIGRAEDSEAGAEQLDEVEEVAEAVALRELGLGPDPEVDAVALGQRQHRRRPHRSLEVHVELHLRQGGDGLGGNEPGVAIGGGTGHASGPHRARPATRPRTPGTSPASRSG